MPPPAPDATAFPSRRRAPPSSFVTTVLGLTDRAQILEFHLGSSTPPNQSARMLPIAVLPKPTMFDRSNYGPHLIAADDRLLLVAAGRGGAGGRRSAVGRGRAWGRGMQGQGGAPEQKWASNNLSSSLLPDDILFSEILSYMPAKFAARCRCVSRSWNHTLSSPSFIRIHLQRANIHPKLFFARPWSEPADRYFYSWQPGDGPATNKLPRGHLLNPILETKTLHGLLLAYCQRPEDQDGYYVCNPSTGAVLRLPDTKEPRKMNPQRGTVAQPQTAVLYGPWSEPERMLLQPPCWIGPIRMHNFDNGKRVIMFGTACTSPLEAELVACREGIAKTRERSSAVNLAKPGLKLVLAAQVFVINVVAQTYRELSVSCSESWHSLSDPMLATRRSLRAQTHLPGTRTSAGHLVFVATSPLNPYATRTARRTQSCRRTGPNSCPARSPPRSGWRRADDDHREGPTREKLTRGRRLGPPNHAPATPHIVTYQHHFVGLLQSPAPPPRRDDRHAPLPDHCEYLGHLRVRRLRRTPSSIGGEAKGAAAGKRAPVLRFARIDRLGDRGRRRRPRERGHDRRGGGGEYLASTPASELWIGGCTQPHMCRNVNWARLGPLSSLLRNLASV
ncbi:hypothetical protein QYE76_039511 [Lolium multiflorum]|uniref:F-box domain-containing protein n=1 Tax=Lolium multiflorum TaxID=4521 RepID=A0AAD8WUJ8_LOLMU|nr:hypothetical protein QYE76_039511 [Lolium multiflorum]